VFALPSFADKIEGKACRPKCRLKTAGTCGLAISAEINGKKETLAVADIAPRQRFVFIG
jgi:hypothetical protein